MKWSAASGLKLPERCRVPWLSVIGRSPAAVDSDHSPDIRIAYGDSGIGLAASIRGRQATAWCRQSRPEDSDGIGFWIDTRSSPGIHRATKFCHRFLLMPAGGGDDHRSACVVWLPIRRARVNPKVVRLEKIRVHAIERHDGYDLSAFFPASELTGYDPANQPTLSIHLSVADQHAGNQSMTIGPPYPVDEDPSLWTVARLTD